MDQNEKQSPKILNENSSIEEIRAYINTIMQKENIKPKESKKDAQEYGKKVKSSKENEHLDNIEEFDKLKTKVLKYITYKKRTEKEIYKKFSSTDINQNLLEDVIEQLKENGYISDDNYIERAVREFLAINTLSIKEMKNKLYSKGLDNNLIESYFTEHEEEIEEYEINNAKKIILKKQAQMEQKEIEVFLYRKGYKTENIKKAIQNIE